MSEPKKTASKYCRECGTKIPRDSLFCEACGASLTKVGVESNPVEAIPKTVHPWYAKRIIVAGVVLLIVILGGFFIVQLTQPRPSSNEGGYLTSTTTLLQPGMAPDFSLPTVGSGPGGLTGQTFTLSSFLGDVVLLEFMEPWSPHCQNMASVLNSVYSQYSNGNVRIVSVSGPWNGETAADAASFVDQYGTGWTYVYDSAGTIFSEYGVNSVPTYYIISTKGLIINTFVGEQTQQTLSAALTSAGG